MVREIYDSLDDMSDYDDDMDGDNASALASAGWGTDEDYGCPAIDYGVVENDYFDDFDSYGE